MNTQLIKKTLTATVMTAAVSATIPSALADNHMTAGERLKVNKQLTSNNGFFNVTMEPSGNLVLRRWDEVLWESNSATSGTPILSLQGDNNIVIYDITSNGWSPVWSTGTWNTGVTDLYLQNDGKLIARTASGQSKWSTPTWQWDMGRLLSGLGNQDQMQLRTADSNNDCLRNFSTGYSTILRGNGQAVGIQTQSFNIAGQPLRAVSCNYDDSLETNWQYSTATKQVSLTYDMRSVRQPYPGCGTCTSHSDTLVPASDEEALCLDVQGDLVAGAIATTYECDAFSPTQQWNYDSNSKQLSPALNSSLCLHYDDDQVTLESCSDSTYPNNKWAGFGL